MKVQGMTKKKGEWTKKWEHVRKENVLRNARCGMSDEVNCQ